MNLLYMGFLLGLKCFQNWIHQALVLAGFILLFVSIFSSFSEETSGLSGETLSKLQCQRCHLLPLPELLDKKSWTNGALKRMAPYLGINRAASLQKETAEVQASGLFPSQPLLSVEEWVRLSSYYVDRAPDDVSIQPPHPHPLPLARFRARPWIRSSDGPCTSLLHYSASNQTLWVGDAQTRTLKTFDRWGHLTRELHVPSGPVNLIERGDRSWVTLIGRILPSDELMGQLLELRGEGGTWETKRVLTGIRRPVAADWIDMNGDGIQDLVVASFGNRLGGLSWYSATQRPFSISPEEHPLHLQAGTVGFQTHDWNHDGRPDLTVLRAQGQECVEIYFNEGQGKFTVKKVIEFPPSYGACQIQLVDMNQDGTPEILVVNGDKGDYPSGSRGYHGIRVYEQTKPTHFEPRLFYPIYGAYGVAAEDFDRDGDIDLAVVAFFPDFDRAPDEGFVYLENRGGWNFQSYTTEVSRQGRWILVEAGDLDGDGDIDLLLGSFVRGPNTIGLKPNRTESWEKDRLSVLLLENLLMSATPP